jgi:hypothetical protein
MATTWFRIRLSAAQVAADHISRIQDAFEEVFVAAGSPDGVAMFGVSNDDGSDDLYFNPAAAALAEPLLRANSATRCAPPLDEGTLALLVGHPGSHRLLSS